VYLQMALSSYLTGVGDEFPEARDKLEN